MSNGATAPNASYITLVEAVSYIACGEFLTIRDG